MPGEGIPRNAEVTLTRETSGRIGGEGSPINAEVTLTRETSGGFWVLRKELNECERKSYIARKTDK